MRSGKDNQSAHRHIHSHEGAFTPVRGLPDGRAGLSDAWASCEVCHADPEAHRYLLDRLEARLPDGFLQGVPRKKSLHRSGQVAIRPRTIPCQERGGQGHHSPGIEPIGESQDRIRGFAELKHQQATTRAQDPAKLRQGPCRNGDVPDPEGNGDDVRALIGKLERHGVAFLVGETIPAGALGTSSGDFEHFRGEIDAEDLPCPQIVEDLRQIPRAARHVDDAHVSRRLRQEGASSAPALVLPEGMKPIVAVVTGRDRPEHPADPRGFLQIGVWIGLEQR